MQQARTKLTGKERRSTGRKIRRREAKIEEIDRQGRYRQENIKGRLAKQGRQVKERSGKYSDMQITSGCT
jgi:hypothetical protein